MNKEKLNTELGYLEKLAAGLKTLKEEQFEYIDFVSEFDKENECGTVCCAWGWMPRFVPESGLLWEECGNMSESPEDFFYEIKPEEVWFMFYGDDPEENDSEKFGYGLVSTLPQVINRIEHVIKSYE